MNMSFAESASVYGVSGLDACCACGGGNQSLVSINEGKQGLDAASDSEDDDASVEMLSYTVFIVAITLSLCALMLLLVHCDRVIQRRRAAVILQEENKQATRYSGIVTMPNTVMSSHEPGTVLIDGAIVNRPSTPPRPRLFAGHASSESEDSTIYVPVSNSVVGFPGLVTASLVGGFDEDDVVLFEEGYADVDVRSESRAASEFSDLDRPVTVVSSAGGEQVLYAGDLELAHENMERSLSRLTSIATHSSASSASEVEYNGPSFANFFDNREATIALERRGAAGMVEADLTGYVRTTGAGDAPPLPRPWTPLIAEIHGFTGDDGVPCTLEHSANIGGVNTNFFDDREVAMAGPAVPAAQDEPTAKPEPAKSETTAMPAEASVEPAAPADVVEDVVPRRVKAMEAAVVEADLTGSAAPSQPKRSTTPSRQKSWHPRAIGSGWDLVHVDEEKVTESRAAAAASPALEDIEGSSAPSPPVNGLGLWARNISNSPALRAQTKNGLQSLEPH